MTNSLEDVLSLTERRVDRFAVTMTEGTAKTPPKPQLPKVMPTSDDAAEQCAWLTSVFNLDAGCPIIGGRHYGHADGRGHIELARFGRPALEVKPASHLAKGASLFDTLVWQLTRGDGELYQWNDGQARRIATVVHWLCDASAAVTAHQETDLILTTYIEAGEEVEGNTYGDGLARHEAVVMLRPVPDFHGNPGRPRYLVDTHKDAKGEDDPQICIRVGDLSTAARKILGQSLPDGWLDAQLERFGWERVEIQGYSKSGRRGRVEGRHAAVDIYRGPLSSLYDLTPQDADEGSTEPETEA